MEIIAVCGLVAVLGVNLLLALGSRQYDEEDDIVVIDRSDEYDGEYDDIP